MMSRGGFSIVTTHYRAYGRRETGESSPIRRRRPPWAENRATPIPKPQTRRYMEPAQHVCMMEPKTISAPGLERGRPSGDQVARRGRRFLLIAVALSVAAHVVAALLVVLLPRVLPRDTAPQEQGTVELLMVEQKGTIPSQSGQQPEPHTAPARAAPAGAAPAGAASRSVETAASEGCKSCAPRQFCPRSAGVEECRRTGASADRCNATATCRIEPAAGP
jgi:hypothetical protein